MNDMAQTIIPKSDQLNADDLIAGSMTVTITGVDIRGGQEQPISIHYEGENGKPYKACKSMCRVMVTAWGPDSKKYVGRSMTLYRDPAVKWAGMEVGGIRISHMSHIDSTMTMALTATRQSRKPFTVKPLKSGGVPNEAAQQVVKSETIAVQTEKAASASPIPEDAKLIEDIDMWIGKKKFKAAGDLATFIKDDALKATTLERIQEAYNKVAAAA